MKEDMPANKKRVLPRRPGDPTALLKRGAIAILLLVALAVALNLLQQILFPEPGVTPTPAAVILPLFLASIIVHR